MRYVHVNSFSADRFRTALSFFNTVPDPPHTVQASNPVVPKLFRSTAPLVPYTHPQRPPAFFKKHKCVFVSTFILYLKNRLNKIITVKLNVLCVN
jgi:hypothetical protein